MKPKLKGRVCACSNVAIKIQSGHPICQRCWDLESRYRERKPVKKQDENHEH